VDPVRPGPPVSGHCPPQLLLRDSVPSHSNPLPKKWDPFRARAYFEIRSPLTVIFSLRNGPLFVLVHISCLFIRERESCSSVHVAGSPPYRRPLSTKQDCSLRNPRIQRARRRLCSVVRFAPLLPFTSLVVVALLSCGDDAAFAGDEHPPPPGTYARHFSSLPASTASCCAKIERPKPYCTLFTFGSDPITSTPMSNTVSAIENWRLLHCDPCCGESKTVSFQNVGSSTEPTLIPSLEFHLSKCRVLMPLWVVKIPRR
jgi:hypothetical protein